MQLTIHIYGKKLDIELAQKLRQSVRLGGLLSFTTRVVEDFLLATSECRLTFLMSTAPISCTHNH